MLKAAATLFLAVSTVSTFALQQKSICGTDDRTPSSVPEVGRLIGKMTDNGGCTVTMIGKTCAISAGHCKSTFGFAEFNTPESRRGNIQHPEPEDIYEIDKASVVSEYTGLGNDWAVMRIKKNSITKRFPGAVQGNYTVAFETPVPGEVVRITGYGLDRREPTRNLAQQTHTGEVTRLNGSVMYHVADTMGGNSGSSIIREADQKIVAIHTNGGCYSRGGSNAATVISENEELAKAIRACLKFEREMDQ